MNLRVASSVAYQLFHDGALALARAERQGIRIDVPYCERMREELTRTIEQHYRDFAKSALYQLWNRVYGAKINVFSPTQLARILYDKMKFTPPKETNTGQGSTDDDALRRINLPELAHLLEMRKLSKIRDTYLSAFLREQVDGHIHPSFNLHLVRTFRSSSDSPNLQNVPKRDAEAMRICRRAILPRPGHMLVEADFAMLEVMIAACYCKDPVLLAYVTDRTSDMHLDMAKQIFKMESMDKKIPAHAIMRQAAKNSFVFPQFYGDYYGNNAAGLADWMKLPTQGVWKDGLGIELPNGGHVSDHLRSVGIKSIDQFTEHLRDVEADFWGRRFQVYKKWREEWVAKYRRRGFLQMHTGFVCSGVMNKNEIINYPIQGTAFHCLLKTFIEVDAAMRKERWRSRLVGQVHDSMLLDVWPEEFEHVKGVIHHIVREYLPSVWKWIVVPLDIDIEAFEVDGPWMKEKA